MIRVNLIKTEKKEHEPLPALTEGDLLEKKKAPVPTNLLIVAAVVIVAVLGFMLKRSIDRERRGLEAAQAEKKTLEPVLIKLASIGDQKAFLEKKIQLINDLKARQGEAVRLMETLSETLPDWVWLNEARFSRRNIQIKGKALTNIQISDFMHNLERSGMFELVSLIGSAQKNQGGTLYLEFTLSANVPGPAPSPAGKPKVTP
jgi:type IV pilus assembly protein PilN